MGGDVPEMNGDSRRTWQSSPAFHTAAIMKWFGLAGFYQLYNGSVHLMATISPLINRVARVLRGDILVTRTQHSRGPPAVWNELAPSSQFRNKITSWLRQNHRQGWLIIAVYHVGEVVIATESYQSDSRVSG